MLVDREAAALVAEAHVSKVDLNGPDWHEGQDWAAGRIADAIRALPGAQVAVKPLVWEGGRAKTPFGDYFVYQDSPGMWCVNFEASHMVLDGIRVQPTEASAKAAAQADYDARIRAALDVAPVSLADAARVLLAKWDADAASGLAYGPYEFCVLLRAIAGEPK